MKALLFTALVPLLLSIAGIAQDCWSSGAVQELQRGEKRQQLDRMLQELTLDEAI